MFLISCRTTKYNTTKCPEDKRIYYPNISNW